MVMTLCKVILVISAEVALRWSTRIGIVKITLCACLSIAEYNSQTYQCDVFSKELFVRQIKIKEIKEFPQMLSSQSKSWAKFQRQSHVPLHQFALMLT